MAKRKSSRNSSSLSLRDEPTPPSSPKTAEPTIPSHLPSPPLHRTQQTPAQPTPCTRRRATRSMGCRHDPNAPTHIDLTEAEESLTPPKKKGKAGTSKEDTGKEQAAKAPIPAPIIQEETPQRIEEEVLMSQPEPSPPNTSKAKGKRPVTAMSDSSDSSYLPSENEEQQPQQRRSARRRPNREIGTSPLRDGASGEASKTDRYKLVSSRKVTPTIYIDESSLLRLGLYNDVFAMLDVLGIRKMMTGDWFVNEGLTFEFFSSVESYEEGMRFNLGGVAYKWSFDEVATAFGLPEDVEDDFEVNYDTAWRAITYGAGSYSKKAKAVQIRNPAIRYVHRLLVYVLSGRHANKGAVERFELKLLWCMLKGKRVPIVQDVVKHLCEVARRTDAITVGGLVTAIADHVNLRARGTRNMGSIARLDIELMKKIGAIQEEDGALLWMVSPTEKLPMPNPSYTTLDIVKNHGMRHATFPKKAVPSNEDQLQASSARPRDSDLREELEELRCEHAATRARLEEMERTQDLLWDIIRDLVKKVDGKQDPGPSRRQ